MAVSEYRVRGSLIDRQTTYRLGETAFEWEAGDRSHSVAYGAIERIRLIDYASPAGTTFQRSVRVRGGPTLKIRSQHFLGVGRFEDRGACYAPFVRALLERAAVEGSNTRFLAGSTGLWVLWVVVGLLIVLMLGVLVIVVTDGMTLGGTALSALIVALVALPLAWRSVRKGGAKPFDPEAPPPELLGDRR
jgi:hypothetical protein